MSGSSGSAAWKLTYQLSPIILLGGIAQGTPDGAMPILSLLQGPTPVSSFDQFFANFEPLQGGTLIDNAIGNYPLANQAVAANAIIAQPLAISMLMICPVQAPGGYATQTQVLTALKASLDQHNQSGGTYSVITPAYTYTPCVMTGMRDVSGTDSHQRQVRWQLDFLKPLLTLADAQAAQNNLMSKFTSGTAFSGAPSNSGPVSGNPPAPPLNT